MGDKMKNLLVRTLSGIVLAVVVLGGTLYSKWTFGALLLLLVVGGLHEFYNLVERPSVRPQRFLGMLTGVVLFLLNFLSIIASEVSVVTPERLSQVGFAFLIVVIPTMFICELYRRNEHPAASIATTLLGIFYVALPLSLMLYIPILGTDSWQPMVMIGFILVIWANDVFAYLVGITLGRHRLCERLSPKKSWEGFIGGLVGAMVAGWLIAIFIGGGVLDWIVLALIAALTGVFGDLAESMLKRSADVKDSGSLIPGHGGILDRFDAMLLAAPYVFVYLYFF